jgi:hypothetical protein
VIIFYSPIHPPL